MRVRAIIFDVGGVLLQTVLPQKHKDWENRLRIPEGSLSQTVRSLPIAKLATIGQATEPELWEMVGRTFDLDPHMLRRLEADFWAADQLDLTMIALVRALHFRYKTAILSNAWSGARDAYTRKYGLDKLVDTMVISSEVGVAKPDSRIYDIALARLCISPAESLFIDDVETNVIAAQTIGMHAIHFQSTEQAIEQVRSFLADDLP